MKKIKLIRKKFYLQVQQRIKNTQIRIKNTVKHKLTTNNRKKTRINNVINWVRVYAPEALVLTNINYRDEFLKFINLVSLKLNAKKHVEIIFNKTLILHPCGTLILKAHLDNWKIAHYERIRINYPSNKNVLDLFQHIKLLEDFGLDQKVEITSENVVHWKHFSHNKIDANFYKPLTTEVVAHIKHTENHRFGGCIDEAVSNCVNHAYIGSSRHNSIKGTWWMFSSPKENGLFVAIYDIGIGIPRSLKSKKEWNFLRLNSRSDCTAIQIAVETEQTSTDMSHRGKGLPEMLEFCRTLETGQLVILSGKGGVIYNGNSIEERTTTKFKVSLPGTLVLWDLPLKASITT